MCGIIGSIGEQPPLRLLDTLAHRGPDGRGLTEFELAGAHAWLGHTRLAIQDLSQAGNQPMTSQNGRWSVTYNGEIFNHLDLRRNLPGPWRGHSDTETLVELLANRGIADSLGCLNGIFAFAAVDHANARLYLVRDPFGVKPLYYSRLNQDFAFASEIRALRELNGAKFRVDPQAVQLFFTLRYVPSPTTLWDGISRLPPGHVASVDLASGEISLSCYISPTAERFSGSLDDAAAAYHDTLKLAIDRQLLSDVPVGVLLSGGIDSALVAALAKANGHELPCFAVGFGPGHDECEIADAKDTASSLGLPFSSIQTDPESLKETLHEIVWAVEEPLGTTSILPMWKLVQMVKQHVTVVLTGQGSDEPWGGYKRYQLELVRALLPGLCIRGFPKALKFFTNRWPDYIERSLRALPIQQLANRAIEAAALFSEPERLHLTGNASDGGAVMAAERWISWLEEANCLPPELMMRLDTRMNLADDLLLYSDKISMAHSLELRVPMLDIELVRFVESLPQRYRVTLARTKIVHRLMARRYLTANIINRRKKAFAVPFSAWSRGSWKEFCESVLLGTDAPHWTWLRRSSVERLWHEHLARRPDRTRQIFSLLTFAIWCRQQDYSHDMSSGGA